MNTGLDLTISAVIGGVLLLLLLNLNTRVNDVAQRSHIESYPQNTALTLKDILDYDLPKIGYGLVRPKNAIISADTSRFRYAVDSSRAGAYDSVMVEYIIVRPTIPSGGRFSNGTTVADSLPNRSEIFVYRRLTKSGNTTERLVSQGVTSFKFVYFNASGSKISTPVPSGSLNTIKMVKVEFTVESRWKSAPTDQRYSNQVISKFYRPRNLL